MIAPRSYSNRRDPSHTAWVPPLFVFLRRSPAAPLTHVAPARAHGCGEHWTRHALHLLCSAAPVPSHCTRSVALHPFRRTAPVPSRYTRYVALHPIRRGAMPTDRMHHPHNKHNCGQLRSVTLQACFTKAVQEALHPLRRATPVTSRCTRSEGVQCLRIGCTAAHNKHNRENVPSRKRPRRLPLSNRRGLALTIQLSRSW